MRDIALLLRRACWCAPAAPLPPTARGRRRRPARPSRHSSERPGCPRIRRTQGTLRIFLPDGTLVIDSCWETYRLARWQMTGDRQIEWQEDTARIAAEITQLTDEQLQLRLRLTGGLKEENYRRVPAPFLAPTCHAESADPECNQRLKRSDSRHGCAGCGVPALTAMPVTGFA